MKDSASRMQWSLLQLLRYSLSYSKTVQAECNEVYFNCWGAACLIQRQCKPNAMKFTSIAEAQPVLFKDSASRMQWSLLQLLRCSLSYSKKNCLATLCSVYAWQFEWVKLTCADELFARSNSTRGANICASAAVNTNVRVDWVLFAFWDCTWRTFVDASTACNAVVTNYVSHNSRI